GSGGSSAAMTHPTRLSERPEQPALRGVSFDFLRGLSPMNRAIPMRRSPLLNDPDRAWSRFEPSGREPWDLGRVAHLHRRAGFSASWETLQRDLAEGPEASIGRLLDGGPAALDGTPAPEFERLMDALARGPGASGGAT